MNMANKKPFIAGIGVVGLAVIAWLAFGFFGIQAAFIDNEVDESADDLFTTAAEPAETEADTEAATETEVAPETEAAPETTEAPAESTTTEAPAVDAETTADTEDAEPEAEAEPEADAEPEPEPEEAQEAEAGEIVTIASGTFSGVGTYSVAGNALVLNNGTEQRFLRFEDFVSDNGPDLKVYLRAANGDFVSLGDLSGNIGDQNYEIPVDVDLEVFSNVEIWCERFSAGFGVATLA